MEHWRLGMCKFKSMLLRSGVDGFSFANPTVSVTFIAIVRDFLY